MANAFRLGPHLVLPAENRIVRDGAPVQIEPKVMDVLVCLAESGNVVSREQLIGVVWSDVVVTDHVLSRCISELRKALDDDPQQPRFVETIRKKDYRLIPRAEPITPSAPAPTRPPLRLIAVSIAALAGAVLLAQAFRSTPRAPTDAALPEVPITALLGSELDPAVSPDGRQVAFAWTGETGHAYDIYILTFGAAEPVRRTEHPGEDKNPTWSPDGQQIAFVRAWIEGSGLWVVPATGGEARRLLTTISGDIPDLLWTPDGGSLIYVDRPAPQRPFAVMRLDLATLEPSVLSTPPPHFFGDRDLALSRDGRRIVFARAELEGVEDLYVIGIDGGTPARLTRDRTSITGIEWIDAQHILFSSDRVDGTRLWEVHTDGGDPQPVRGFGDGASDPHLTADDCLLYERRRYRTDIWRTTRGDDGRWTDAEPLISSTRADTSPSFSPDGTRIAFVTDRAGDGEIWVCDRDGRRPQRLTSAGDYYPETLSWSPNGAQLAFVRRDERQMDLWIVTLANGAALRLTDSPDLEFAPQWSGDGRAVYFGSDRSGDWQIWRVGIDGKDLAQVTHDGGHCAVEAGEWLYFVRPDRAGLYRLPHTGGAAELVLPAVDPGQRSDFVTSTAGIYFRNTTKDGAPGTVAFFDFATATAREVPGLTLVSPVIPQLAFTVAVGGATVLFTHIDVSDSDLLMVEGFSNRRTAR